MSQNLLNRLKKLIDSFDDPHLNLRNFKKEMNTIRSQIHIDDLTSKESFLINQRLKNLEYRYYQKMVEMTKTRDQKFDHDFKAFINQNKKPLIFIIAETKHKQNMIMNRPVLLLEEFIKQGFNVIYAYRRNEDELFVVKTFNHNHFLQAPLDLLLKHFDDILKVDRKNKIVLFEFPIKQYVEKVKLFKANNWLICYDIRDNWKAMKEKNTCGWFDEETEKKLIEDTDIIYVVSNKLKTLQNVNYHKQVYVVPNGLKSDFTPAMKSEKNKNTVGYIGQLNSAWFNFSLLKFLASKNPDLTFEIIGPHNEHMKLLKNVRFLGEKTKQEAMGIVSKWETGIIPFQNNAITTYCDPLKTYEYIASHLNIVSTNIPQIKDYPLVTLTNSYVLFSKLLRKKPKMNHKQIQTFLKKVTMEKRVTQILKTWGGL